MRLSGIKLIASFFLAAVLSAPAWGATPALPGTLNYVEGQASIGDQTLNAKSVGSVDLQAGQTISTGTGKAEVLLTPGVFFRLGDDSAATLVSPSLTNTEIALSKGHAMVEVDDIHKDNVLRVQQNGATTQLLKTGIYEFDAANGAVRVYKGEALVQDGDRQVNVKGGHQLAVATENTNGKLKTTKFSQSEYQDTDLYGSATFARSTWRKPTLMPPVCTGLALLVWMAPAGTGIRLSGATPGFRVMASLPVRSAGVSTRLCGLATLRTTAIPTARRGRPYVAGRPYVTGQFNHARPGYLGHPQGFRGPTSAELAHLIGCDEWRRLPRRRIQRRRRFPSLTI